MPGATEYIKTKQWREFQLTANFLNVTEGHGSPDSRLGIVWCCLIMRLVDMWNKWKNHYANFLGNKYEEIFDWSARTEVVICILQTAVATEESNGSHDWSAANEGENNGINYISLCSREMRTSNSPGQIQEKYLGPRTAQKLAVPVKQ